MTNQQDTSGKTMNGLTLAAMAHQAKHSFLDVAVWVVWFAEQLSKACQATCGLIAQASKGTATRNLTDCQ